ncbi:MAG: transcriptional regulator [Syntrophobacterales bacterium GWC2_56_13]|nr:MAG: transcriptional regulator [Syntrophobacterales bacterium GWC2_56_13]OHE21290.1 MAG: transcriptional regulator [Syntrophobacterales bacterium GWF2_56_9]
MSLEKAFGSVLRCLRQDRGLSQEALGFESGYHRTYISLLERGQKSPSLQTIFNLSKALKIAPADLIKQVEFRTHSLL